LEVSFLDVGQGNASILTYKDTNIMIDSGGDIYSNYNKGKEEIPDYLIKKGIFKIDLAFISHFHEDHYCSYEDIQDEAYVEKFFSYRKNDQISYINNEKIIPLDSSKSIMIDDNFKINIIWPDVGDYYQDENDNSLVLLINFYDTKILYTGDISKRVEENLIDRIKDEIDIILVPHHGSNTSSSKKFVEKIKPQNAVFSYGRNFYGIPSTKVVELYKNNSSKIYSTFKDGEIWSIINKDGKYKIWAYNENNKNEVSLLNILMVEMFLFLILNYAHERDLYNEKNRKI
jgi:competence protein ComEC